MGYRMVQEAMNADRPYAVAFVDMRMPPGWDGVETVEHLWQEDPELQVVICTAFSDHAWEDVIQRLNKNDKLLILRKPFDNIEVWQLANSLTKRWAEARQAKSQLDLLAKWAEERAEETVKAN
jgi:two-component system NtrC family sensor kinase